MNHKNNKKIIIMVGILFLLIIYVIYHYITVDNTFDKFKINKNKNIVYSIYQEGDSYVPCINIKGVALDKINEAIVNKANDFLKGKNTITYTFDINGKILSVAIQYVDYYDESGYPKIDYDVYNVNFYESSIVSDEEMLQLYGISEDEVSPIIEAKFGDYYNDIKKKKILNNECDYYDCFLHLRGINNENYMENVHYYIKNGNLYVIKPFNIYSIYKEDEYFSTSSFLIQITKN